MGQTDFRANLHGTCNEGWVFWLKCCSALYYFATNTATKIYKNIFNINLNFVKLNTFQNSSQKAVFDNWGKYLVKLILRKTYRVRFIVAVGKSPFQFLYLGESFIYCKL